MEKQLTLKVSEHFYSIQGEGQTMGFPSYFLRLTACNMVCGGKETIKDKQLHDGATWRCDSIESWSKGKAMSFKEIIEALGGPLFIGRMKMGAHLIFTGGEPLLQQKNIIKFIAYLEETAGKPLTYEIETNGSVIPSHEMLWLIKYWNVSPKLKNSGVPEALRINTAALEFLKLKIETIFKFVISRESDYDEVIEDWIVGNNIPRHKIWLMPAADNREELVRVSEFVAVICMDNNMKFSSRLHINIWNQKTGV